MFSSRLWQLFFRLFSQNPAPGPDGNHPADNYFLFAGAGDRGGCGPRAVCKYSGAQANRPFLYLDFPWNAAFGTAVRRVLRSVQSRHRSWIRFPLQSSSFL